MSKHLEYGLLLDFYSFILTDKQMKFLDMYYNEDYSLSEIAVEYGVTRQAALDNIKRGTAKLVKVEQELGLYKKFDVITNTLQECKKYINETKDADLDIINKIDYALDIWEDSDGV